MKYILIILIAQATMAKLENKINYLADILIRENYIHNNAKQRSEFVKRQLIDKSKGMDKAKLEKIIDDNTSYIDLKSEIKKKIKESYTEEEINKLMAILETPEMRKLAKDIMLPIVQIPHYRIDIDKVKYEIKALRAK